MAKKPTFYPNLPRDPSNKKGRRVDAISVNTAVRVRRIKFADNLYKPLKVYTPFLINENTSELLGTDSRSGTKNPGWRVTIARGGDASSGYSREHYAVKLTKYRVKSETSNDLSFGSGLLYGGMMNSPNDTTALDDRALARLKNRLSGKVGNAQLGPPLAESREIYRLVRQINDLAMSTFKALLAAKKSGGKSITKQLGDIWLGYGFGVNPLLNDIKSAADSILHYVTRENNRVRLYGSATQVYHTGYVPVGISSEFIAKDASIAFNLNAHHTQGIRYVAAVDLNVRCGNNYSVTDHLGLKVEALPSILWELTAFSWAVDYFTTVGPWLEDMFYTLPATIVYLNKSYKYQSVTTASPVAQRFNNASIGFAGNPSTVRYTVFVRTKLAPVLPTRALRIKTADEIASHGLTKLLNLASVLAGKHGPNLRSD